MGIPLLSHEVRRWGRMSMNYCLSYARGFMAAENKKEYLHEWEDGTMRLKVSDGEQVH